MSEMVTKRCVNHKGPCTVEIMTCNFCQEDLLRGPLYHFMYLFYLHDSILPTSLAFESQHLKKKLNRL